MAAVVPDRAAVGRDPMTGGKALGSTTTLPGEVDGAITVPGVGATDVRGEGTTVGIAGAEEGAGGGWEPL